MKKNAIIIIISIILYIFGAMIIYFRGDLYSYYQSFNLAIRNNIHPAYLIFTAVFFYFGVGVLLMSSPSYRKVVKRFLNINTMRSERSFYYDNETLKKIVKEIDFLKKKNSGKYIKSEEFIDETNNKTQENSEKKQDYDEKPENIVEIIQNKSLSRLSDQVVVLGSRANRSLNFGIAFCVAGLIMIFVVFFIAPPAINEQTTGWVDLYKTYLPRASLVLLVQIIGFFFLRLYRSTLMEIRYIQNETTNIEMKLIALWSSTQEYKDGLESVIDGFIKTERNHILEKNQTTAEIEKQRVSAQLDKDLLNTISDIFKSKK